MIFSRRFSQYVVGRLLLAVCLSALPVLSYAQTRKVTGTVLDEKGEPLVGAIVATEDNSIGAMADEKGAFSISLPSSSRRVVCSFLGYDNQIVNVEGKSNVTIVMVPDADNILNEVVVIGYGQVKKSDLTGSVANVKMSDIGDTPGLAVDQALQGRIAGVDIMSTTGEPGANTSIRIRGTRSITASNEPLLVVDGVVDAVDDIADINPDDIQSISVLKDASSTAIYGARGANGVVIITTKAGVTSKPSVTAKAQFGVSKIARTLDLMNAQEFIRYRNDRYYYSGVNNPLYYDPSSYGEGTDWIDAITRVALYQNYNVSMSGKSGSISYYASIGYVDQQGIVKDSGSKRVSTRLNLNYNINKWFSIAYKGSYSYKLQNPNKATIGGTSPYTAAIYLTPTLGELDVWNPLYEQGSRINTPVATIMYNEHEREYHTTNNTVEFVLKPVKGLKISSKNTYMVYQRHDYRFYPSYLPKKVDGEGAEAYRYEGDSKRLTTENTVSYSKKFRRGHTFDALAGYIAARTVNNYFSLNATGLLADELTWNNMNGIANKENYTASTSNARLVRQSVILRANYNYKNRYYLTFTARADGSSNFASNHKWGFFPSGAFKWNMKNEKWLKKEKWLNELSLRASFGVTGNDAIPSYRSLEQYSSSTSGYLFDGSHTASFYLSRVGNPDLTWEKTSMGNIAIDFTAFDSRLNVTLEAYASRTKDLLLTVQTAQATGFSTRYANLGLTSNTGVELSIDGRIIDKRKFSWNATLTLSHNRQMVHDIGNEDYVGQLWSQSGTRFMMYGYKKGYPLNSLWGFQYAGPWRSVEDYERNSYTHTYASQQIFSSGKDALGHAKYVDIDNDGQLSERDLLYLGNSDPVLHGGLQNTFHIGNWKVAFFFNYSLGGKIYNYSELFMSGSRATNQYRYMLDAFHPVRNPDGYYPRSSTEYCFVPSTLQVHDATYLRLKNASVSYTFDLKKSKIFKNLALTLSGDNLLLWTAYNGFDPDVSTESDNSTLRRVDLGAYPKSRTVMLGVTLKM